MAARSAPAISERIRKMKELMEKIMEELQTNYAEHGRGRTLEYTYGYMDAMAVIRELAERDSISIQ